MHTAFAVNGHFQKAYTTIVHAHRNSSRPPSGGRREAVATRRGSTSSVGTAAFARGHAGTGAPAAGHAAGSSTFAASFSAGVETLCSCKLKSQQSSPWSVIASGVAVPRQRDEAGAATTDRATWLHPLSRQVCFRTVIPTEAASTSRASSKLRKRRGRESADMAGAKVRPRRPERPFQTGRLRGGLGHAQGGIGGLFRGAPATLPFWLFFRAPLSYLII